MKSCCDAVFGHADWCRTRNAFVQEAWEFAEGIRLLGIDRKFLDDAKIPWPGDDRR